MSSSPSPATNPSPYLAGNSTTTSPPPTSTPSSPPPPSVPPPTLTTRPTPPGSLTPPPESSPSAPRPGRGPPSPRSGPPRTPPSPSPPAPPPHRGHPSPRSGPSRTPPFPSPPAPPPHRGHPSPPSPSPLAPPPHRDHPSPRLGPSRTPSSPSPLSSYSVGISAGVVVGLAIGGVALLVILGLIFLLRKKKGRRDYVAAYYAPPPPPSRPKAGPPYGGLQQHWRQQPPSDHVVTSLPPPQPKPPSPSPPPPPPPPPPPFMSRSSSGSSEYYDLPPPSPVLVLGFSKSTFTYEELAIATNGFSEANLLGKGGFGYVHKGILPSGKAVAVKQLKVGSGQGEREIQAEVEIISRVHHRHLVSLVGYCMAGGKRLLVYEYVPNNNLEFHLHAMFYVVQVADFGLAKLVSDTNTHLSTRVMGTFGYVAPEYAASGKLTEKSDVFSFGVVLLELITGRPPVDANNAYVDDSLVDWARPLLNRASEQGEFEGLVDTKMNNEYDTEEMARMIACAAACLHHSACRRPRMSQIVRALEGNILLSDLNEGMRPGHSTVCSSYGGSTDYDSSQYNDGMKKLRKALETQEYNTTDEYSNTSSDYGLYPSCSSSDGETTREMELGEIKRTSQGYS
ncbi:hypothetical protein Bca4012_055602 [Brassica carinata]